MKKNLFSALAALTFLFLLLNPQKCFQAASAGLLLWYKSLVPALFPAMILSNFLIASGVLESLPEAFVRPVTRITGISAGGLFAVTAGFLCGCPMGVKVLADLRENRRIGRAEAVWLAGFVNNLSPSFVMNFLVITQLKDVSLILPTLCILYGAPLLYALFSRLRFWNIPNDETNQAGEKNRPSPTQPGFRVADACILDSILNITKLGGYVILFSVCTSAADILPLNVLPVKAFFTAAIEVSGGIQNIAVLPLPFAWKYLLLIAAASFGGLCCAAQSAKMLQSIGLPLKNYLKAKLSITAIAVLLAACYLF